MTVNESFVFNSQSVVWSSVNWNNWLYSPSLELTNVIGDCVVRYG